jgi:hypothetical protein
MTGADVIRDQALAARNHAAMLRWLPLYHLLRADPMPLPDPRTPEARASWDGVLAARRQAALDHLAQQRRQRLALDADRQLHWLQLKPNKVEHG